MFKICGKYFLLLCLILFSGCMAFAEETTVLPLIPDLQNSFPHARYKFMLGGKPAVVNVITIEEESPYEVRLSFGRRKMRDRKTVSDIAKYAYAGVNAQYFKGDGTPLGLAIVNGKFLTGPLFERTVFGVTEDEEYEIGEVKMEGNVSISRESIPLTNINQPILSSKGAYIYNNLWGKYTPRTSSEYYHLVIKRGRIKEIATEKVGIPSRSYVVVVNKKQLTKEPSCNDRVRYKYTLIPDVWNKMEYAVAAGPVLVRDGQKFIPNQKFQNDIFKGKAPRTAIGFSKENKLIILTVDGRQKGISEGATLSELADLMIHFGAYQAMNFDGGGSTQMVVNGYLVNCPSEKPVRKVTNALVIYRK